jgi:hypothetical protein
MQTLSSKHNHLWLLAELEGILSGIAADGVIRVEELRYLEYWLHLSRDCSGLFPYSFLERVVEEILDDGVITTAESQEMLAVIRAWSRSWPEDAGPRETVATESGALEFIQSVPLDRRLSHLEIARFRVLTDFFVRGDGEHVEVALRLLCRVLDDRILTREERSALVAEIRRGQ